jgi:hypothetical protein
MITAYPAKVARFKRVEANLEHYVLDVQRDVFRHYVSLADRLAEDAPVKQHVAKSDYEGLINDLYYQNIVLGQLHVLKTLTVQARELKLATEEISKQLSMNLH